MEVGDMFKGRKCIDKWKIEDIDIKDFPDATVPFFYRDKNGNIWLMQLDKSILLLKK